MEIKNSNFENSNDSDSVQQDKIDSMIKFGEHKIKQIHRRISENEVKLESMESHSDYEYKDLLKEFNEAEKDHKKDLSLFLDLLCKYKITII